MIKNATTKIDTTTEVVCGIQRYNTFSEKRAKTLIIFFLFSRFFLEILMKPNRAKPSLGQLQMMSPQFRSAFTGLRFAPSEADLYLTVNLEQL
jgi:hypothetical protein